MVQARSTQRYVRKTPDDDRRLIDEMRRWCEWQPRFGSERVHRLGISEQTYYRWRTKYGGMDPQMAKQLQELQKENARLKRLVADQALDNQILREAARPNW